MPTASGARHDVPERCVRLARTGPRLLGGLDEHARTRRDEKGLELRRSLMTGRSGGSVSLRSSSSKCSCAARKSKKAISARDPIFKLETNLRKCGMRATNMASQRAELDTDDLKAEAEGVKVRESGDELSRHEGAWGSSIDSIHSSRNMLM